MKTNPTQIETNVWLKLHDKAVTKQRRALQRLEEQQMKIEAQRDEIMTRYTAEIEEAYAVSANARREAERAAR